VRDRAVLAVGLASLGILLYIWYAFRRIPNSVRYGVCAIASLLHDSFLVLGVFSILGRVLGVEVDSMFVTALLTVIGFSVHDTIVVFDRIRENMLRHAGERFEVVVNHSILQTMGRSLMTTLTVLFTLLALFLFGGITTRTFALTLLIGIASGTYSSIFNAGRAGGQQRPERKCRCVAPSQGAGLFRVGVVIVLAGGTCDSYNGLKSSAGLALATFLPTKSRRSARAGRVGLGPTGQRGI
jgi:hypothetical protein